MSVIPCLLTLIVACIAFISTAAWTAAREERLPLELHVVNEGIAHDDNHWFFSNKHILYKTSVWPIEIESANYKAIPDELKALSYNHIGDIDVVGDIIFGGVEADHGNGVIALWNTTDLSFIRHRVTEQGDMPWVAVDQVHRRIYSAHWNDCCQLYVYDIDSLAMLDPLKIADGSKLPPEVQGGAFYRGDLYIATNENDAVYKVDIKTGEVTWVLNDAYDHHQYEMEGLDFWDLRTKGLGVMHMFGNFMQLREKAIRSYDP